MIKIKERKRMAHIIFKDIINGLEELSTKAEKKNLNDAYLLAFQMRLEADIEDSLKKLQQTEVKPKRGKTSSRKIRRITR